MQLQNDNVKSPNISSTMVENDQNAPNQILSKTPLINDSEYDETGIDEETPIPDWIAVKEPVLIKPHNHLGIIRFIGKTHFSVIIFQLMRFHKLLHKIPRIPSMRRIFHIIWNTFNVNYSL